MADKAFEYAHAIVGSFDKSLKPFDFHRTVPVVIYVDAGDESRTIGRRYAEIIAGLFAELDFRVIVFKTEEGSFCQLNICESKVPLDELSMMEKLGRVAERIHSILSDSPIPRFASLTGSAATAVVAIGTFVQFVHGEPKQGTVLGNFTVPAIIWTVILATKEGKSLIKDCREFFTESKAFKKAWRDGRKKLKEGEQTIEFRQDAKIVDKQIPQAKLDKEERIKLLEGEMKEFQDWFQKQIDELKKED